VIKKIARHYKQIVKGNSIVDTLTDNLSLGALIDQNQQISSEIKPGGIAIDTTYTANATKLAIELLAIKGLSLKRAPQSAHMSIASTYRNSLRKSNYRYQKICRSSIH
jgi:hypothetical protein